MPDLSERNRLETILPALDTARVSGGSRLWRLCLPIDTVRRPRGSRSSLCALFAQADGLDGSEMTRESRSARWDRDVEKDSSESDGFFPDRRQSVPETAARRSHRRARRRKTLTRPTLEHLQTWAKPRPSWDTAVRTPPSAKAWTIRPSLFFSRELPPLAGYFPPAMRPAARFATRVSAYRLPEGHPRALRTCRIPTVLPCEPSRAPDADPPRRFNILRPVTHYCQLTLRFSSISSPFSADSGDWQGWGAPDIHDDDGEPRARSPRSSVNLSSDSRRNSIDEPVRCRSIDLRNHGGGEGAIQGLDDPPLR